MDLVFDGVTLTKAPQTSWDKPIEIRRKTNPNRRKFVEKSLLDGFWRSKPFQGRAGTRSGQSQGMPKHARGRSWDPPGAPRAAGRRPKVSPERFQDAPGPVRSDVGAQAARPAPSDVPAVRFLAVFVLSCDSSDVLRVPVFTMFCWPGTKGGPIAREQRTSSKIQVFRLPKSSSAALRASILSEKNGRERKKSVEVPPGLPKI